MLEVSELLNKISDEDKALIDQFVRARSSDLIEYNSLKKGIEENESNTVLMAEIKKLEQELALEKNQELKGRFFSKMAPSSILELRLKGLREELYSRVNMKCQSLLDDVHVIGKKLRQSENPISLNELWKIIEHKLTELDALSLGQNLDITYDVDYKVYVNKYLKFMGVKYLDSIPKLVRLMLIKEVPHPPEIVDYIVAQAIELGIESQ